MRIDFSRVQSLLKRPNRSGGSPVLTAFLTVATLAASTTAFPSQSDARWPLESGSANIWLKLRGYQYLRFRTQTLDVRPRRLIAHLERDRIDPTFNLHDRVIPADAWEEEFERINSLRDLRDFTLLDVLTIYLAYGDHPALDPSLLIRTEEALKGFKYWLTDPTPPGLTDETVYWTENHQVTFYALEYLAGGLFPEDEFYGGENGAAHQQRAEAALLRWFDRKARFGFNEFLSDVYYAATLRPLCLLVDFAEPNIAKRAAMILDLLLLDMALNTQRSNFGGPHGRSFKKDKTRGGKQDTWDIAKVLFANTTFPYEDGDSVLHLIRSTKYRLPKVIVQIGRHKGTYVNRQRTAIPAPNEAEFAIPPPPAGFSYDNPLDIDAWWGMGAYVYWPVVPLTFTVLDGSGLWDSPEFSQLQGFRGLPPSVAQQVAVLAAPFANANVLSEVNIYTWRSRNVMLSSAVDYRQGFAGVQSHSWQATIDAEALVFTNHPFAPLVPSTDWAFDLGYFTGEASWPRSAQIENVGIHIYAPQWHPSNPEFPDFIHQTFTHAFFPQDRFDEVTRRAGWTIGRKGNGYIALYSWRPADFVPYPDGVATDGMTRPFDLVASGGANNVWIVEVGTAHQWGSFEAFKDAITATAPQVVDLGTDETTFLSRGFDVVYESPSQGHISFGWAQPLVVNGRTTATSDFPRYDNPWTTASAGSGHVLVEYGRFGLELDFVAGTRRLYRKRR